MHSSRATRKYIRRFHIDICFIRWPYSRLVFILHTTNCANKISHELLSCIHNTGILYYYFYRTNTERITKYKRNKIYNKNNKITKYNKINKVNNNGEAQRQ